jgi:hypothetical protein
MNPEHLFSSGVVSVADRAPPHGPAAGPAIRPQPGRVSPGRLEASPLKVDANRVLVIRALLATLILITARIVVLFYL